MKETSFIEENKEKWGRFEKAYNSQSMDPDELSDLYMDITDDLSYAQTFYKRRTVRVYLNQLAQKVFTGVHKQKSEPLKRFLEVWSVSLPLEVYRSRKNILFALVAFLVYCIVGAFTTYMDPDFPRTVMGDGYVNMTIENIQNGNPLKVYETDDQLAMFIRITTNNLKVAFLTFFVGFFFTIGTHILLFYNGVMLGAFQYFFHAKGLLITSFLGIWIHGAFEISAIVLAGGAGITAGNGLLFPKSYTRIQSLQLSTKRGLKIMFSLVPFIIAAGFLESFVTANYQDLPDWSKWFIILLSFAIILFFYLIFPMYIARKHADKITEEETFEFQQRSAIDFHQIRSVGTLIADSFRLYRLHFGSLFKLITPVVVPVAAILLVVQDVNHYELQKTQYWFDWAAQLEFIIGYGFRNVIDYLVCGVWSIIIAYIFTTVFYVVQNKNPFSWKMAFQFIRQKIVSVWLGGIMLFLLVFTLPWYLLLPALLIIPFFYLNAATMGMEESRRLQTFKKGFSFSKAHYGKTLLLLIVFLMMAIVVLQPIAFVFSMHETWNGDQPLVRDLLDMGADFVKRVAQIFTDDYMVWSNVFRQIVYVSILVFALPLIGITMMIAYFTEKEKTEAIGLKKEFQKFGKRSRSREKEVDYE